MTILRDYELAKPVQQTVKEMETKHNCLIFLQTDGDAILMSVAYFGTASDDFIRGDKDIKLGDVNASQWETATAIRRYFRSKEVARVGD